MTLKEQVYTMIREEGEMDTIEICDSFPQFAPKLVQATIGNLKKEGLVVSTEKAKIDGFDTPINIWKLGHSEAKPFDSIEGDKEFARLFQGLLYENFPFKAVPLWRY